MADLDTLAALAAMTGDEPPASASAPRPGPSVCANCGARLTGRYCADCGQQDGPLRVPFHRFVSDSFREFFGLDGRVWTTFGVLLFKPGKLTAAYLQGHRRRYLSPLRVYLTATLLFFVLLTLLDPVGRFRTSFVDVRVGEADSTVVVGAYLAEVEAKIAEEPARVERARQRADSLRARADSLQAALGVDGIDSVPLDSLGNVISSRVEAQTEAQTEAQSEAIAAAVEEAEDEEDEFDDARGDSADRLARWRLEAAMLRALPPDSSVRLADVYAARAQIYPEMNSNIGLPGWMVRSEAAQRINEARTEEEATAAGFAFSREVIGHIPTVLFLILPLFALLLKLLYVRRGWYYSEHLVFGLHTHAFAFAVFSVVALLAVFGSGENAVGTAAGVVASVLLITIPLYFLLAQKRVYGQGWIKTILKSLVLGWTYFFVLIAGLIGVLLLAAALG